MSVYGHGTNGVYDGDGTLENMAPMARRLVNFSPFSFLPDKNFRNGFIESSYIRGSHFVTAILRNKHQNYSQAHKKQQ